MLIDLIELDSESATYNSIWVLEISPMERPEG